MTECLACNDTGFIGAESDTHQPVSDVSPVVSMGYDLDLFAKIAKAAMVPSRTEAP
jgi:hypothetical protein